MLDSLEQLPPGAGLRVLYVVVRYIVANYVVPQEDVFSAFQTALVDEVRKNLFFLLGGV